MTGGFIDGYLILLHLYLYLEIGNLYTFPLWLGGHLWEDAKNKEETGNKIQNYWRTLGIKHITFTNKQFYVKACLLNMNVERFVSNIGNKRDTFDISKWMWYNRFEI